MQYVNFVYEDSDDPTLHTGPVPDGDAARGVKRVAVYEHDHDEPAERKRGPKDKMEASNG